MQRAWNWLTAEGDRSAAAIRSRVFARPSAAEAIVVGSIAMILVLSSRYDNFGIDWEIFAGAADGQMVSDRGLGYYYAYWLLPLFDLYDALPFGGLLWSLTNVAGVWFAARVFGARPAVVVAGFGAVSAFFTGTVTGVAVAAIAGIRWALHERRFVVAGALGLLAVAKPQWGIPFSLVLLVQSRPRLTELLRSAIVPLPVIAASFWAYGWWPAEILDRAAELPPEGNGSLWFFIGPMAALVWLPLLLPMAAKRRLGLVVAASMLGVPYVQQYDFTVLWLVATDGLGLLSYAYGPLYGAIGWTATRGVLVALPAAAYVHLVRVPLLEWWQARQRASVGQEA